MNHESMVIIIIQNVQIYRRYFDNLEVGTTASILLSRPKSEEPRPKSNKLPKSNSRFVKLKLEIPNIYDSRLEHILEMLINNERPSMEMLSDLKQFGQL